MILYISCRQQRWQPKTGVDAGRHGDNRSVLELPLRVRLQPALLDERLKKLGSGSTSNGQSTPTLASTTPTSRNRISTDGPLLPISPEGAGVTAAEIRFEVDLAQE